MRKKKWMEDIEKRLLLLENPPLYKVGDKVEFYIDNKTTVQGHIVAREDDFISGLNRRGDTMCHLIRKYLIFTGDKSRKIRQESIKQKLD